MSHEIPTAQEVGAVEEAQSAAGNLFDLRLMIGGLFVFYGLVLIIAGLVASSAELHKAADININLWMGIGMLVLGALFLLWWRAAPLARPEPATASMQPVPPPAERGTIVEPTSSAAQSASSAARNQRAGKKGNARRRR